MDSDFQLNPKQLEAKALAQSPARFILFRGGSRSGKSFAILYFVLLRAFAAPNSRHGVFRKTAIECRTTLFDLTFKQVMDAAYPGLWQSLKAENKINDTEMTVELPNGSTILFNGLDDSARIDRIRAALVNAVQDGAIQGVSSFAQRVLKSSTTGNLESLIDTAVGYQKVLDALAESGGSLTDTVKAMVKPIDDLAAKMKAAGATSEELAKVEQYRKLKLDEIMKEQLGSLQDFQKELRGEAGGYSKLTVLNQDLAEFEKMRATITAGGTVDQSAFTELGQSILGNAGDLYGTSTSTFANLRQMLQDTTSQLIGNIQDSVDDATVVAIQDQTTAITGAIAETNELLRQAIVNSVSNVFGGGGGGYNGIQVNLN